MITPACIFLSVNLRAHWGLSLGALGIIAACVFWGLDNNFARNISAKDPVTIISVKGLAAGSFSLGLEAIASGFSLRFPEDEENLAHQFDVYNALYAWCRMDVARTK